MNPGEAPEETWTSEDCQAYLDKTWSSSSFVKVYHYEQHDVVYIETLEDDKKQALRTQVIAMLEQRRGRTLPEEARVYVGDASPYILTELDDAISVMQLQALPGVHSIGDRISEIFLPAQGKFAVHVFDHVSIFRTRRAEQKYWYW